MNLVEAKTYDRHNHFYALRGYTNKGFKDSSTTNNKDITACLIAYDSFDYDPKYWVTTKLIIPEVFL